MIGTGRAEPIAPHQGDHHAAAGRGIMEHVPGHVADGLGCARIGTRRHIVDRNDDRKLDRVRREEEQPQRAIAPRVLANELTDAVKYFSVCAERSLEIIVGGPSCDGHHGAEPIREPTNDARHSAATVENRASTSLPVDDNSAGVVVIDLLRYTSATLHIARGDLRRPQLSAELGTRREPFGRALRRAAGGCAAWIGSGGLADPSGRQAAGRAG